MKKLDLKKLKIKKPIFKILDFEKPDYKKSDFKKPGFKKLDFINSYYMVIFPKLTSVTRVPLVEPINSYYMVIIGFFDDCLKKKKDDLLTCMASPQVKILF